jgi:hypothetical protein
MIHLCARGILLLGTNPKLKIIRYIRTNQKMIFNREFLQILVILILLLLLKMFYLLRYVFLEENTRLITSSVPTNPKSDEFAEISFNLYSTRL